MLLMGLSLTQDLLVQLLMALLMMTLFVDWLALPVYGKAGDDLIHGGNGRDIIAAVAAQTNSW